MGRHKRSGGARKDESNAAPSQAAMTTDTSLNEASERSSQPMDADCDVMEAAAEAPAATPSGTANGAPAPGDLTSKDYYFDSYSHFGIHEEMIKDGVRTRAYKDAIYQNPFLFKDKIVLDVGCGTGILSLFCAKAGAAHVYAVECSEIALSAMEIVKTNGFQDKVTVIKGKIEEIQLPVSQVDIIISEWMGYFLLYESMLDSVLFARDKWLVPGGLILPDKASLYVCAIEDQDYKQEKIHFWENVYGFDMSCIKKQAMMEPLVDTVEPAQVVTAPHMIKTWDITTMAKGEGAFTVPFRLTARRKDFVHALVVYFDVTFSQLHKPLSFTTSPNAKPTHWKQSVLYLEDVVAMCEGEQLKGSISCTPNAKNPRDLDIELDYRYEGVRPHYSRSQRYRMR